MTDREDAQGDQPREPAGSSKGGQFAKKGGGVEGAAGEKKPKHDYPFKLKDIGEGGKNWTGANAGGGHSIQMYNEATKQWETVSSGHSEVSASGQAIFATKKNLGKETAFRVVDEGTGKVLTSASDLGKTYAKRLVNNWKSVAWHAENNAAKKAEKVAVAEKAMGLKAPTAEQLDKIVSSAKTVAELKAAAAALEAYGAKLGPNAADYYKAQAQAQLAKAKELEMNQPAVVFTAAGEVKVLGEKSAEAELFGDAQKKKIVQLENAEEDAADQFGVGSPQHKAAVAALEAATGAAPKKEPGYSELSKAVDEAYSQHGANSAQYKQAVEAFKEHLSKGPPKAEKTNKEWGEESAKLWQQVVKAGKEHGKGSPEQQAAKAAYQSHYDEWTKAEVQAEVLKQTTVAHEKAIKASQPASEASKPKSLAGQAADAYALHKNAKTPEEFTAASKALMEASKAYEKAGMPMSAQDYKKSAAAAAASAQAVGQHAPQQAAPQAAQSSSSQPHKHQADLDALETSAKTPHPSNWSAAKVAAKESALQAVEKAKAAKTPEEHAAAADALEAVANKASAAGSMWGHSYSQLAAKIREGLPGPKPIPGQHAGISASSHRPLAEIHASAKEVSIPSLKSMRAEYSPKLTHAERDAVLTYSGHSYGEINDHLRAGKPPTQMMKEMDAALAKAAPKQDMVLHRGLDSPPASWDVNGSKMTLSGLKPGDQFVELGYSSASAGKKAAFSHKNFKMVITVPKGYAAAPIPSHHSGENEVLIRRNTKFQLTKIVGNEAHVTVIWDGQS